MSDKSTPKKGEVKQKKEQVKESIEINKDIEKEKIGQVEKIEEVVKEKSSGRISKRRRNNSNFIDTDKLDKKRKVPVVSVNSGTVGYICKLSPQVLVWSEYGDEHVMTIEELLLMYSQEKDFLTEPWLIVDDEEFSEVMNLDSLYETIFEIENLEDFYSQQLIKVKKKIADLPSGTRRELLNRTVNAINEGELNNLAIVKLLKTEYNIDVEI